MIGRQHQQPQADADLRADASARRRAASATRSRAAEWRATTAQCRAAADRTAGRSRSSKAPNSRREARGDPPTPARRLLAFADALRSSWRMNLASSQMSTRHQRRHAERDGAARPVLQRADRLLVGEDRIEPGRAARAAAGHQEDQAELVEGRDERQQQHHEDDVAQPRQRDVAEALDGVGAVDLGRLVAARGRSP